MAPRRPRYARCRGAHNCSEIFFATHSSKISTIMAHTKAIGSTKLGRDSQSKRLGVKLQNGQKVTVGQIIIRQRGTKYSAGANVLRAGDDTLYAGKDGTIKFFTKTKTHFDGNRKKATFVAVN